MAQGRLLSRAELIEFSKVNPWVMVGMMLFDWSVIVGAITASIYLDNWAVYILAVIVIGARLHGLGILAHEVAHYRFLKNRVLSEWIANLFLTWPLFYSVDSFRKIHLAHHKHLNSDKDPDFVHKKGKWRFPRSRFHMIKMILGDLLAVNLPFTLTENKVFVESVKQSTSISTSGVIARILYYGILLFVLIYFGWIKYYLIYWIIPFATWTHMVFKLRSIAEHYAIHGKVESERTRTVLLNYLERLLITPHHINMHIEHHEYPSVPFYKLLKLHKRLSRDSEYLTQNHFTKSFVGVINECSAPPQGSNNYTASNRVKTVQEI